MARLDIIDRIIANANDTETIIDILTSTNIDTDGDDWNDILCQAATCTGISVEDILAQIKERNEFDEFLANKAETQYRQMISAENIKIGCDNDI